MTHFQLNKKDNENIESDLWWKTLWFDNEIHILRAFCCWWGQTQNRTVSRKVIQSFFNILNHIPHPISIVFKSWKLHFCHSSEFCSIHQSIQYAGGLSLFSHMFCSIIYCFISFGFSHLPFLLFRPSYDFPHKPFHDHDIDIILK